MMALRYRANIPVAREILYEVKTESLLEAFALNLDL